MAGSFQKSIGAFLKLKAQERQFAAIGAAGSCLLLASYTVLRPIRDELGIRGGVDNLQWSFTLTFIGMLVCVPLFGAIASRLRKRLLLPVTYLFFASHLVIFSGVLSAGERGLNISHEIFARVFFSWVSIFNLIVISLFWTTLSDRCSESRGRVLFGPIAAGGSFGAFLGPLITSQAVRSFGAPMLLQLSAVLLLLAALVTQQLPVLDTERSGRVLQNEAIGGDMLQGLQEIPKSAFLLRMALLVYLGNVLGTYLYFQQASILAEQVTDPIRRTEILSYIDLSANSLTLLFQVFVTPLCLNLLAPRYAFSIVPAVMLLGFPVLVLFPSVPVLFGFQTIRRASTYALGKPVESLLYSVRPDDELFKARNVIDTLIYRLGDTSGAWMMSLVKSFAGAGQFLWQLCTPIGAVILLITAYRLGENHEAAVKKTSK